jgi:surfeit locus 1 family protein
LAGRRGYWRFSPGRVPTVAVIVLLPILVWLGIWQLQRAEYKEVLAEDFAAGSETVFIDGPTLMSTLEKLARFQHVSLTGRYASDRQFLLDNMTDGGAAGYHVLTPFLAEGSDTWILVNRGWIPKSFGTSLLPDVAVNESNRRVAGRISRLPRPGLELEADSGGVPEWPRVVQFPTAAELAQTLGTAVPGRILLLDASAEDGYLRSWAPTEFGPERHYGYALQWFALAATLIIIYLALNLKRSGNDGR